MVVIPAGSFTMGSPDGEPAMTDLERPQRRVSVRRFAVSKFDVTRQQWAAFAAATQRPTAAGCAWTGRTRGKPDPLGSWSNLGFPQDDTHPVVCVTWQDAQDYAQWLSQRSGRHYRLPAEAEWEYAARAGTDSAYPWGAVATHDHANYGAEECCTPLAAGADRWEYTSPVGSFPPNAFGLYDMHGNVMQWVQDCLSTYAGLPTDGSANERRIVLKQAMPFTPSTDGAGTMNSCDYRMLRGGDWGNPPPMIRSASRNLAPAPQWTLKEARSGGIGIRVALSLP